MTVQIATRVDQEQADLFKNLTRQLGTTPSDALRMFINSFNAYGGFPYQIRISPEKYALPFETEEEALDFADSYSMEMLREMQ